MPGDIDKNLSTIKNVTAANDTGDVIAKRVLEQRYLTKYALRAGPQFIFNMDIAKRTPSFWDTVTTEVVSITSNAHPYYRLFPGTSWGRAVKMENRDGCKFYFGKPVSWATSASVLGEPELQGETTNLKTAERMILTPKGGKIDARGIMRKRQEETYRTAKIGYLLI